MSRKKETDQRIYPHDLEAERAVLAGCRATPVMIDAVLDLISASDFYRESHRKIFTALVDLHREGTGIDRVTLAATLSMKGQLDEVGGHGYLATLLAESPMNLMSHVQIVADMAHARKALELNDGLADVVFNGATPTQIHDQALKVAQSLEPRQVKRSDQALSALMDGFYADWDAQETAPAPPPIPTPWEPLTRMLNGGWRGGMRPYYIGARRKVGKTSAAYEIAVNAAVAQHVGVAFFEIETMLGELIERMLAGFAEVPYAAIQSKRLDDWQRTRLSRAAEMLYVDRLRIDASRLVRGPSGRPDIVRGCRTIEAIRRAVKRMMLEQPIGLIVIDHLQKIEPPFPCPIFDRVTLASNGLADLAQEFGVPVVAMLQLNEGPDMPSATDTRGGQEIGNDCQALMLLDRPPMRRPVKEREQLDPSQLEEASIIVALHGNGSTGTISMRFAGPTMRWYQAVDEDDGMAPSRMESRYAVAQNMPPEAYELDGVRWEDEQ